MPACWFTYLGEHQNAMVALTLSWASVGHVLRSVADRLTEGGSIDEPDHLWAREFDKVFQLLEAQTDVAVFSPGRFPR
jgi:hypothetical protein